MSAVTADAARKALPDGERPRGRGEGGPAEPRTVVSYGFWIFILSDIIMFSAFFAAYAVLSGRTAGGPTGKELFDLKNVAIETGCLLLSSFTCGILTLQCEIRRNKLGTYLAAAATFLLGAMFLVLEIREFIDMATHGAGPDRSAFLSAFFTLVGLHGLHVTAGLIWLVGMIGQIATFGFRETTLWRLHCFALFWHALDIIWVALFTLVYLMGVL
jgi:cytochrome o ubiquinol oxidase subunit 3